MEEKMEELIKLSESLISNEITHATAVAIVSQIRHGIQEGVIHFAGDELCNPLLTLEEIVASFKANRRLHSWHSSMLEDCCGWHIYTFLDNGDEDRRFINVLGIMPPNIKSFVDGYRGGTAYEPIR